jgi:hypothetical protein
MGRYCQERARQVLNDFAAVGTFLLNYEETASDGLGGVSAQETVRCIGILCCVRRSSLAFRTANPEAAERSECLRSCIK